VMVFYFS